MCQHCQARRRFIANLEQDLSSSRPDASAAIHKIDEASRHANCAGQPFKTKFGLLKAHYLLGLQEPPRSLPLVSSSLRSCYDSKAQMLDISLRTDKMKQHISRDLRLKSLPAWIAKLDLRLKIIDVSGNPNLSRLPLHELCDLKDLKEVRCQGCVALSLPPPEVADQGGAAVVRYLRIVREDGEPNTRMNLILIGSGEAGKTSVLQALKSKDGRAGRIDVDEGRTIGIDVHDWHPQGEDGLTFDVMDFGGQAVYGKTNQYFIVRRALYVLVWSVRGGETSRKEAGSESDRLLELKSMTSYWMRAIQARVPGASVLLVATHIDLAECEESLKLQSEEVRRCVEAELKLMSDEEDEMILPLNVLNHGESYPVNCLTGDGIAELRKSVFEAVQELLWWKELIPRTFLRLEQAVKQRSRDEAVINMSEYMVLVKQAKVHEEEVKIATTMLHEMGVLKYFGHKMTNDKSDTGNSLSLHCLPGIFHCLGCQSFFPQRIHASRQNKIHDNDVANAADITTDAGRDPSKQEQDKYSFEDSVFISPAWMIEVLKGVMRHDWRHLDTFKGDAIGSKKVRKLLQLGIIDEDILKNLWPREKCDEAHTSATRKGIDVSKAVALLRGCDLAHFLGAGGNVDAAEKQQARTRELLCPGIIPHFMRQHQRAVSSSDDFFVSREYEYNIFPAGFTERLVVRCAGRHEDVDCSAGMAVMRGWGRLLVVSWSSEDVVEHTLRVDASTLQQMENFEKDLRALEAFFPGMKRRRQQSEKTRSGEEKVQVGIFWYGKQSKQCAQEIKKTIESKYSSHCYPLNLSCNIYTVSDSVSEDSNFLVNVLCISMECSKKTAGAKIFYNLWNKLTHKKATIIPVILEDYKKYIEEKKTLDKWWPVEIEGMEQYRIFHEYKREEESMRMLYEDVMMKLRRGQGSLLDSMSFCNQNKLLCQDCMRDVNASEEVGEYDLSKKSLQDEDIMMQEVTCSKNAHRKQVKEVLSFNNSFSPCPSCAKQKRVPHFFSRRACLSKLDRTLTAKEYCPSCQREVDVIDVVPPQVFLSYNWGAKLGNRFSTQEIVRQVKQKIEENTSLQCWFDVEGGINVGEDHLEKMQIGVERCEVLVLFVSNKYVESSNCRREYLYACQLQKHIIPVFVPVLFEGEKESESGWKGSKEEGWWRSIAESHKNVGGVQVDWNHLALFPKTFDLTAQRDGNVIQVRDINGLVDAVQARAYRGAVVFHEKRRTEQELETPTEE